MTHPHGDGAAVDLLLANPRRAGVFSDFDGTLSSIVDDPEEARPLPGAVEALALLAGTVARVGVISGRPASFLLAHLNAPGVSLWGLHGLETVEEGRVVAVPGVEPWRAVVAQAAAEARRDLAPATDVEDKTVALTLHFRRNPAVEPAVRRWADEAAARNGLVVHGARMSYELRPPVPHGKDQTLLRLAAGLDAACFVGDDLGDAVAFDALDQLAAASGLATLRIAVDSDEAPPSLLERADLVVDGPAGAVAFLRRLAQSAGGG